MRLPAMRHVIVQMAGNTVPGGQVMHLIGLDRLRSQSSHKALAETTHMIRTINRQIRSERKRRLQ